ncbi:MAG: hypothetical protein KA270_06595 [Saprospiraceae bacterium]|nr:hypothetical protein [Saprospiraceae bacterium]MBP6566816.1 hypothetical protein [Saprospiraceae bacterium]
MSSLHMMIIVYTTAVVRLTAMKPIPEGWVPSAYRWVALISSDSVELP